MPYRGVERQARSETRQYVFRGTQQSFDADGDAALYPSDERIQQEVLEPCSSSCSILFPLQLLPYSFKSARHSGDGGRVDGSRSEEHTSELQSLTNLVCRL